MQTTVDSFERRYGFPQPISLRRAINTPQYEEESEEYKPTEAL